jgi:hypothetical protein
MITEKQNSRYARFMVKSEVQHTVRVAGFGAS